MRPKVPALERARGAVTICHAGDRTVAPTVSPGACDAGDDDPRSRRGTHASFKFKVRVAPAGGRRFLPAAPPGVGRGDDARAARLEEPVAGTAAPAPFHVPRRAGPARAPAAKLRRRFR